MKKLITALALGATILTACSTAAGRETYRAAYCYETRESIKQLALQGKYDIADALMADYKRECPEAE